MPSTSEILNLSSNISPEGKQLIEKAYSFAQMAHKDHKRFSGEPYFNHLFETAKILAELGQDAQTISAGLLHDSIEDVNVAPETIEKEFGQEILFLVQGVTKLGQLRYHGEDRHVESLRKLFVAMAQDVRVVIIKLADRLHNVRTLQYVPEEKRKRIALETLEVYGPIAYRLGIRKINRELENLAFPFAFPDEYLEIKELLGRKHKENQKQLEKFVKTLKKELAKNDLIKIQTDFRVKSLYSLYKKYLRKEKDFEKIYDVQALRIIVPTMADCYKALGVVHGNWRPLPGRIKDYIAFPKPNGYQSIHTTIFTGDGHIIEIQIRTDQMHEKSEMGIASHFLYKSENQKKDGIEFFNPLSWIKRLLPNKISFSSTPTKETSDIKAPYSNAPKWVKELAEHQSKAPTDGEFMDNLRSDFFGHRIFVFTPKGDVVDLPLNSTPIDFAYAIHSDIGHHISGVKVNGKLVTLDTELSNGDIIEIITKDSSKPTKKWVDMAKTASAKRKIKAFLENQKQNL